MDKITLRKDILNERSKLSPLNHLSFSKRIISNIISTTFYKNAQVIMCFVSFADEVDTHEFIKQALADGKRIVVPIAVHETKELKPSELKSFDELEPGYYNILTPKKEYIRLVSPEEIDLVLVPGVVFDHYGYRVGYGGGYYDRFLPKLRKDVKKIAIGFGLQVITRVPRESFDVPVDMIITENGLLPCDEGLYETER